MTFPAILSATGSFYSALAGFAAAFVTGCLACRFMIETVKRGRLIWFALYCAVAGGICIISYCI